MQRTVAKRAELGSITDSEAVFGNRVLAPKRFNVLIPMSIEWFEDSANGPAAVNSAVVAAVATELDRVALEGSGTGAEPQGALGSTAAAGRGGVTNVAGVGTPSDYTDITSAISTLLTANAPPIEDMAWIYHPRDGKTYDDLADTPGQPLMPTPWVSRLPQFATSHIDITRGGGTESTMYVGDMSQILFGMRYGSTQVELLREGVTENVNLVRQYALALRVSMRMDVNIGRSAQIVTLSGVTP